MDWNNAPKEELNQTHLEKVDISLENRQVSIKIYIYEI